jgi:minor extracellular serine protease Vpr
MKKKSLPLFNQKTMKLFQSILLFSLLFANQSVAQVRMPVDVKRDLMELIDSENHSSDAWQRYHLHEVNGVSCLAVLAKIDDDFSVTNLRKEGVHVGTIIKDIITLKVPLHALSLLFDFPGITHLDLAGKVKPLLDRIDYDTRLDSVAMAIDLPQGYTGKGVYIGFLDWGYDYTHPMYYDTTMQVSRIAAAWDQFKTSGPSPEGFDYGTEYVGFDALQAAQSDTSNIYGFAYHGGHVAGIAAGGGAGTPYRGVAYEAEMLFATFLIDAAAVIDAYEWMYQKAQEADKRLVINQSWGLYHMGTLDGKSLLSEAIDYYSELGVVFVSSAGNNGSVNFHLEKNFDEPDTLRTGIVFSTTSSPHFWGQSISIWGAEDEPFSVGFQVYNSSVQLLSSSPYFEMPTQETFVDSFLVIQTDTVYFKLEMEFQNPFNQRPHARLRVRRTSNALNLVLNLAASSGHIHAWNVAELTTDVGNMGAAFTNFGPQSVAGDSFYGVGEPGCTESVVTVASHGPGSLSPNGNLVGGNISSFSSYGPIYDGRLKPDLSAPGANIASAISSFTDASVSMFTSVDFNGKSYGFARLSGTSMSSPVVAGIAALMLEANPLLSAYEVRSILIETAYQDSRTGEIGSEGDLRWGWGKVDAYNAIKRSVLLAGTNHKTIQKPEIVPFPNPTNGMVSFFGITSNQMVFIYSISGQLVYNAKLQGNQLDISPLSRGLYLIKFSESNQVVKVVKE